MDAFFKKYFWIVKTLGVAAATGLAASAITTQLGTMYVLDVEDGGEVPTDEDADELDEDEDDPTKKRAGLTFPSDPFGEMSSKNADKQRVADKILAHNVFCPTCAPPASAQPEDSPLGVRLGMPLSPGEIKSRLNLRLTATMEADPEEYSLATVYDGDSGVSGVYGIEDEIRRGVAVVSVDRGVLHIRNGAQLEYIEIGAQVAPPAAARAPEETPTPEAEDPSATNKHEIPGAEDSINCPNENLCIVERKFVDQVLSNPAQLAQQARVVPSQKDGKTQGYKLYGIRRGTLPKLLGLKNGDMITSINGEELTSIDKAMALYTKLRRASRLEVNVVRKGKAMTKEIQIQ